MENIEITELEESLHGLLRMSKASRAARIMTFMKLTEEAQQLEMCEYLLENEEATEGQILSKCRQILNSPSLTT